MKKDATTGESFLRILGRRSAHPIGRPPTAEARQALTSMVQYRTCAPKGVFVYDCHEDMDADRLRWTVRRIVERERDG